MAAAFGEARGFKMSGWLKIALLFAVVVLAAAGVMTNRYSKVPLKSPEATVSDPVDVSNRTPVTDFIVTDAKGVQKKLSDFRGNVVILSFWASWCAPCLIELPTFAELQNKFKDKGLRVFAVNVDEDDSKKDAEELFAKRNFPFETYYDSTKSVAQQFKIDVLPSNFVIDREGRLVFSGFGANDWASDETLDFIQGLLQETASTKTAKKD